MQKAQDPSTGPPGPKGKGSEDWIVAKDHKGMDSDVGEQIGVIGDGTCAGAVAF